MLLFAKDKHEVLTPEHNEIGHLTWEMFPNDITPLQLYMTEATTEQAMLERKMGQLAHGATPNEAHRTL